MQFIRERRRSRDESKASPESSLGSSLSRRAVGDESETSARAVGDESGSSPREIPKSAKKTALDCSAVPEQSQEPKDGVKG